MSREPSIHPPSIDTPSWLRGVRVPELIGREEELRQLDAAYGRAIRFEAPQLVTVLGPMGIGKTRLIDEWVRRLEQREPCRVVRAAAPPAGDGGGAEPHALVAELLRARFGLAATDREDRDAALGAIRGELQAAFEDRRVSEAAGLLGTFLGFELPESPLGQALAMRADHEVDFARAMLARFLEEDARGRPLVVTLDDLHLADDASLDLLGRLGAELGEAPMVIVAAARPELLVRRPEWGRGEGSHARVEVSPLAPLEMDVFVRLALGAETLAPGLATRAAVESGGNPFLLEQLLRAYRQHGILVAETASTWSFDFDRATRERPDIGPEAAAQARIAELSPAERDLLARGATFGTAFWTGGVVALGRLAAEPWDATSVFAPDPSIDETRRMLELLEERGYLARAPRSLVPGDVEWGFTELAERLLLASSVDPEVMRRRQRFAAQWIEARCTAASERRSDPLELVARLWEEGGDLRHAGRAFVAAGDEARRHLRHDRARTLYLRGVRLLDLDDAVLKLDACHRLGDVAARLGRNHEALAHFGEMLRIAWRLDLPAKGGAAHARIGRLHRGLGDYKRALHHLGLARLLFELAGDGRGIAAALDDVGRVHFLTGNPEESMRHHRAALEVRERIGDERGKALSLSWLGLVLAHAGELGAAAQNFRRALVLSRAARDAHGIVFSLLDIGAVEREAGHPERAQRVLEEARQLVREIGEPLYECHLALQIGDCLLLQGRAGEAELEFRAAREIARKFGTRRLLGESDRGMAEARLHQGDNLGARDHAHEALRLAESIGASPLAGAALRVLATAVAHGAPGDPDRGGPREMFDRAVELLGGAGAELELGRTFAAYADFEERTGRGDAAWGLRAQATGINQKARAGFVEAHPAGA